MNNKLAATFGNIDIYLFDQLLKGTYDACEQIVDIGCGGGRNMIYFLRNGVQVYGADQDVDAIDSVRALSAMLAPDNSTENFVVAKVEELPFADSSFDLAICSAVLHFANDHEHFERMLLSAWRVIRPGGFFFARLASDIGIEHLVQDQGHGRYLLPDGSVRYLVNEQLLRHYTTALGGNLHEPLKTTNVSNLRCMTTWCLQKMS